MSSKTAKPAKHVPSRMQSRMQFGEKEVIVKDALNWLTQSRREFVRRKSVLAAHHQLVLALCALLSRINNPEAAKNVFAALDGLIQLLGQGDFPRTDLIGRLQEMEAGVRRISEQN